MSTKHIQIVKWSFPAFALIIGLLWYKRRRVDRADPGGVKKSDEIDEETSKRNNKKENMALKSSDLHDSGIQTDESFSLSSPKLPKEELTHSPRKVSESLDIPSRKNSSQPISMPSRTTSENSPWYTHAVEIVPNKIDIHLGSNPKISNFEMIARSRSASSLENGEINGKVLKIFENVVEEDEQKITPYNGKSTEIVDNNEAKITTDECDYISKEEQAMNTQSKHITKVVQTAQPLNERDSANHSPVSGVLEGSVTDEARSEGSTDSGKGGSIKGHAKDTALPISYEFSIPQGLVGRLIGRYGSFLQNVRVKADVSIVVRRHPVSRESKACVIEGSSEGIAVALDMIRLRFPEKKYPEVTLEKISDLRGPVDAVPWVTEIMQLSLVEGLNNDIVMCHVVKPNRFFVQLPTHPTYPTLRILDENMTHMYNTTDSPPAPEDLSKGMILVANWFNKWVRVYVEQPDPRRERNLVRLVDHGGYWLFSNADLKKIRSDYLALPFQAIEIFLAGVQPKNGEWNQEAYDVVAHVCSGTVGQAQIEGYINTSTYVNLYFNIPKHGVISLADELISRGYAEPVPLESLVPEEGISIL